MSGNHTPGPWDARHHVNAYISDKGVPTAWINLDAPGHIGGMKISTHASMPLEELVADAHLIAAAPELMSVLNAILDEVDADYAAGVALPNWDTVARAAIAKAMP